MWAGKINLSCKHPHRIEPRAFILNYTPFLFCILILRQSLTTVARLDSSWSSSCIKPHSSWDYRHTPYTQFILKTLKVIDLCFKLDYLLAYSIEAQILHVGATVEANTLQILNWRMLTTSLVIFLFTLWGQIRS